MNIQWNERQNNYREDASVLRECFDLYRKCVREHEGGMGDDENSLLACAALVKSAELVLSWSLAVKELGNGCAF
jgi:hypothetical protein